MESLAAEEPTPAITEEQSSDRDKASVSDSVSVTPGANFLALTEFPNDNLPEVTFLEAPTPAHLVVGPSSLRTSVQRNDL